MNQSLANITLGNATYNLTEYLRNIPEDELLAAFEELDLRCTGNAIDDYCKFLKHIAGEYNEEDFIMEEDLSEPERARLKEERMLRRDTFVQRIAKAEETKANLAKSKETPENKSQEEGKELVPWTSPEGEIYFMPKAVTAYVDSVLSAIAKDMDRIRLAADRCEKLEREMEKHATGVMTSTKIARPSPGNMNDQAESNTSWVDPRTVQVNDTFDIRYFQPSLESTTHEPMMDGIKNRINPEEGNALFNGRTIGMRQNNAINGPTPYSVLTDRPSIFTSTDLGKTIRSWNFKFNGSTGMNVEEFLRRVKECTQSARLSEMDVLGSMPELLSGIALRWYRNNKNECKTWAQFCTEARRYFGVTQYFQERLQAEVVTRTQGSQEPVAEYIICAQALMNQLEGKWSPQQQLELLYQNMRPELRKVIPRDQVTSISRLVDLARTQERILKDEQSFREPPPPEDVFWSEFSCKTQKKDNQAPQNNVAIAAMAPKPSTSLDTAPFLEILGNISKRLEAIESVKAKEPAQEKNEQSPKGKKPYQKSSSKNENSYEKTKQRREIKPESEENKDKEPGPSKRAYCHGCAWPGYIWATCPACSGNEPRSN
ncbi:hypothetical protein TKK_0017636 [Trichogramma kaykai]